MFAKLLAFFRGEESKAKHYFVTTTCAVITDVEELERRMASAVLAGIKAEIGKAKKAAARPKVAVRKK